MTVIEPKDPFDRDMTQTSFRVGKLLLEEIDKIAATSGHSRSEAINQMLKWAVRTHLKDQQKKEGAK